jgi:hypothetical protein
MNKKIVAISILMLMMCAMVASVFAEDNSSTEYEYTVTVYVKITGGRNVPKEYKVWAKDAREAERVASTYCADDVGRENIVSCGTPRATGRSR